MWHYPINIYYQMMMIIFMALFPLCLISSSKFHRWLFTFFFCRFSIKEAIVDGIRLNLPSDPDKLASQQKQSRFKGCNLTNARHYYSKYGRDVSPDAVLFKSKALEVLSIAIKSLNRLGVRYWLSSGTCLGKKRLDWRRFLVIVVSSFFSAISSSFISVWKYYLLCFDWNHLGHHPPTPAHIKIIPDVAFVPNNHHKGKTADLSTFTDLFKDWRSFIETTTTNHFIYKLKNFLQELNKLKYIRQITTVNSKN